MLLILYTLLINYLLCAPAQSYIHQGLGIFFTYSTSDFYLSTLYLDDFKTNRTAKHMASKCMKIYRFELLFFDGTVITGKILRWGAVKQPIYLSIIDFLL